LGEAVRKTGGRISWVAQEEVVKKEDNFEIKLPAGCFLWVTRIHVQDDTTVDKVIAYPYPYRYSYFEESWSGMKATAHAYLGAVEPAGFATIPWFHFLGQIEGLDLRNAMIGDVRLCIIPKKGDEIKVTLSHARIII
ncbi:MAG: hypothetical protein ACXQS2_01775, partial [Methermicoccaceae archaeon]